MNPEPYNNIYTHYYLSYVFFPIFEETIEKKDEGIYSILEPKVYVVNLKNKNPLYLYYDNAIKMYTSYTNETNIWNNIDNLIFRKANNFELISKENRYNFGISIIIPSIDDNSTKLIIANKIINITNQQENNEYTIEAGTNAIFNFTYKYNYFEQSSLSNSFSYGTLTIFSSEINNMKFIRTEDTNENFDFMVENSFPVPIYVDKYDKDIKINVTKYKQRYLYFGAINNNVMKAYFSLISEYSNDRYDFSKVLPLYIRRNTDHNKIYDLINYYLYKMDNSMIIYIKKLYGETDIYECNADSINKNVLSIITKPINNCKNKKSILNKIYNLEGTKLITGFLGHNSYFDIFFDLNDGNKKIEISSLMKDTYKNTAKYLKKDIEYSLDFYADHLIKLDPEFNAEISIFDNKGINLTINASNPTAKIKGYNFKIKSNIDAMVYFYGKIMLDYGQIKLDIEKRKNIEIKIKRRIQLIIDFGFEGYNPADLYSLKNKQYFEVDEILYIENIYDKIKTKLVKGESLYLYYDGGTYLYPIFEISYNYENINNPNNEYTFNVIPKNIKNKNLIINNVCMSKIKFQFIFCKAPHDLKMIYRTSKSVEYSNTFNNRTTKLEIYSNKKPLRLTFDSKEDIVFSYSFVDSADDLAKNNAQWSKERVELTNLSIVDARLKNVTNEFPNSISITFLPNYKASTTRYIVIVAPKTIYNTKKKFF